MTSSNVSNLLIQVSQVDISTVSEKASTQPDKGLFMQTLKNVASPETSYEPTQVKVDTSTSDNKSFESSTKVLKDTSSTQTKVEDNPNDVSENIEQIQKVGEEIKEVIKDELDISEEELVQAMETLGLTIIDLFNPQNLAQLVTEITGQEDSVSLLLDVDFKNILDKVTELTNQLFEETNISLDDLKGLITRVTNPEEMEIPVQKMEAEIPHEEMVEKPVESVEVEVVKPEITTEVVKQEKTIEQPVKEEKVEKTTEEYKVDLKVVENDEDKPTKQEFDFSKNEKQSQSNLKMNHEPIVRHDGMIFAEPQNQIQFSVEQKLVSLPSGETVRADNIVNQLVEQARIMTNNQTTTMEMTLNPEGLGKIFMEVTQKGDQITAKIFTENDAVKQALENQMATLRTELNQNSSTKVTSIEVSVGTHEFERNLEQNAQDQNRREEQMREQTSKRSTRIDLNSLDELSGMMSEEDILIAQMMRDNGNSLDFQA